MILLGDFDKQSEEIVYAGKVSLPILPHSNHSPRVVLGSVVSALSIIKHHNQTVWMLIGGFQTLEQFKGNLETVQIDVVFVVLEHRLERKLFRISLDYFMDCGCIDHRTQIRLTDCHDDLGVDSLNTTCTDEAGCLDSCHEVGARLTL